MSIILVVNFVIACFLNSSFGEEKTEWREAASTRQVALLKWRTDLKPALNSTPLGKIFGRSAEYEGLAKTSLLFTDNETVVVTFVTREGVPALSRRGDSGTKLSIRLRPIFVDARTGSVTATLDLGSGSRDAAIIAAHDGTFVTQVDNLVTLYSRSKEPLKKLTLPAFRGDALTAYSSPTGKSILFVPADHGPGRWLWVAVDSMDIVHSWYDTQNGDVSICDDLIAMVTCTWTHDCEPTVEIRGAETDWRIIANAGRHSYPKFVNDGVLFLKDQPLRLLRTDGTVVTTTSVSENLCLGSPPLSAPLAGRLVVPLCRIEGSAPSLDVGGHQVLKRFIIYSEPWKESYSEVTIEGPKVKDPFQLAISPDGQKLAILRGPFLELVELPAFR